MTRTAIVALAFSCLMGASCSSPRKEPVIDASSQDRYDQSLILMTKGLSPNELTVLTEAISIIQANEPGLSLISPEANNRNKISGMSREEIVFKAKRIVLDWFTANKSYIDNYCKAKELASGVSFSIVDSKKREGDPWIVDVSVLVKNQFISDIFVDSFKIDGSIFVHKEISSFKVKGNSSLILKGWTLSPYPTFITKASVDLVQVIPNSIDIPAGYIDFLVHVGVEMRPCSYRMARAETAAP